MKKAAFFLALFFASLAPASVFAASCAQPAAVLVFSAVENDSSEECRSLPAHALKELVETFDMYMTPGISDPVTDLGFSVADEEGESSDEVYLTPETVVSGDAGYGDPSGSEDAADSDVSADSDKGFAGSGMIDSSKPLLQKPSGTIATGPFSPSLFTITDKERDLIERVVMAEVSGRSYIDALAVAQCIYDRMVRSGDSVSEVLFAKNAFADPTYRYTPTSIVKDAVSDVFDDGKRLTVEPLLYFYAVRSASPDSFHETQRCLVETELHRYFGPW